MSTDATGRSTQRENGRVASGPRQEIAEFIENEKIDPTEDGDGFLIGGGRLITGIVMGSLLGRKKGKEKENTRISVKKDAKVSKVADDTVNLANVTKLHGQLVGQKKSGGHAFEKHVVQQGEFKSLSITTCE